MCNIYFIQVTRRLNFQMISRTPSGVSTTDTARRRRYQGNSWKKTFEFFTLGLSDAFLSEDLRYLKLHSYSPPPDHQSQALLTVLVRNLLEMSEVSFLLFHAPLHMESIEHDFIKALLIHINHQIAT